MPNGGPKFQTLTAHRLAGYIQTPLGQKIFTVPKTLREFGIEPIRMAFDLWRKAMSVKGDWLHSPQVQRCTLLRHKLT